MVSKGFSVSQACDAMKISRQAYYKYMKYMEKHLFAQEVVIQRVHEIRYKHSKIGGKKLYFLLGDEIAKLPISLGRDKFFDLLRDNNLLISRKKVSQKTTNSAHNYAIHPNLAKDFTPLKRDSLWVCDITYIRLNQSFMYLSLITDAFSRMIIGFDISHSLAIDGCIRAAKMSIKQSISTDNLIHHSDRGVQYCSHDYVSLLRKSKIAISMTRGGNPYENAMAERVNGILKYEYALVENFVSEDNLVKTVNQAVHLYNFERPHTALKNLTPAQVHKS